MVAVVKLVQEFHLLLLLLVVLAGAATTELPRGYSSEANRRPLVPSTLKHSIEIKKHQQQQQHHHHHHQEEETSTAISLRDEPSTTSFPSDNSIPIAVKIMSNQSFKSSPTIPSISRSLSIDKSKRLPGTITDSSNNRYYNNPTTTGSVARGVRDVPESSCDSFTIGNDDKHEFYSPNYPDNYPNQTDCIKVLKADKGMLLKLDFRERFDLEPSDGCRFDYLEVRDGEHGYANRIALLCGKQFPPEITSKTRYLWLRFHSDESIEYGGFKAIWSMIPRPTDKGVPPEPEPCMMSVEGPDAVIKSSDFKDRKDEATENGVALDCMWVIKVKPNQKVQLQFTEFKLQKPNECDANFVDVFNGRTEMPDRLRNFCGSIADLVSSTSNIVYIRYYVEPRAMNSTFECLVTAYREREGTEKSCLQDEYDCEDARCISRSLLCNDRHNCRFRWDEDETLCGTGEGNLPINKEHIIIILVVFSLIMFGLSFAFVFNCVRKLIRDHRIIQEHIRQSRENRLDEIGRKTTPCPLSANRVDSHDRGGSSESSSLEVVPSKELLPPPPPSSCALLQAHEYARELLAREALDINDIHRSNNASNATQERLQESSEEPETRDNACQTRESLFDGILTPRRPPSSSQCSACGCSPTATCPRHTCVPPPPHGWSVHDPRLPIEPPDYICSYQRFQSPKPPSNIRDNYRSPAKYSRQSTFDSGGTNLGSSQHSSGSGPSTQATSATRGTHGTRGSHGSHTSHGTKLSGHGADPRYRAEAVIELPEQDRRPFSIESTKSAPDVIATH